MDTDRTLQDDDTDKLHAIIGAIAKIFIWEMEDKYCVVTSPLIYIFIPIHRR